MIKAQLKNTDIFREIFDKLMNNYGMQGWWPLINFNGTHTTKTGSLQGYHPGNYQLPENDQQIYEIILGAILTQNTKWISAQKALFNLYEITKLEPQTILILSEDITKEAICCAGFFNQKAEYLKRITEFFLKLEGSTPERKEILRVKGVGEETADSILLYAYKKPEFVVDAYTKRIFHHLGFIKENEKYRVVKKLFESNLPQEVPLFQEYHALLVEHAKRYYTKKPYQDELLQTCF